MKPTVVSLFSGCGGLDIGLEQAGAKTIFACDNFKAAVNTFENYFGDIKVVTSDVRKVEDFPKGNILIGGYPCQGFSLGGKRRLDDDRNTLYKEFKRALQIIKPDFFIAENVKGLLTMANGEVLQAMIEEFSEEGYIINHKLVNAKFYGVPQDRERVFLVGVRNDIDYTYEFPEYTHNNDNNPYNTLSSAIKGIEDLYEVEDSDQSGFSPRFMSRNRKRLWDEVSFTIQASGRQAPMHPAGERMEKVETDKFRFVGEENRKLTYKECALIQTFPPEMEFLGSLDDRYKMIGNAVPPLLAKSIAQPIVDYYKTKE